MSDREEAGERVLDPSEWVDGHGDFLYRYAKSRLRDANVAEDAVQETFLAGIRHYEQFRAEGSQRAWLLGILKRKIVDAIRKRIQSENPDPNECGADFAHRLFDEKGNWRVDRSPWAAEPGHHIELQELRGLVRDCLERIPHNQADVFVLSVMEEMTNDEVCRELGISRSNLWVRLHRARLALAACVGSQWSRD